MGECHAVFGIVDVHPVAIEVRETVNDLVELADVVAVKRGGVAGEIGDDIKRVAGSSTGFGFT